MRVFAFGSFAAALGLATCGLLVAPKHAHAGVVSTYVRAQVAAGASSPWLVSGALSPPGPSGWETSGFLERTARLALSTHLPSTRAVMLRLESIVLRDDGGRVVSFTQEAGGLLVLDRGARVLFDGSGVVVMASAIVDGRLTSSWSSSPPAPPAIDVHAAANMVRARTPFALDVARASLVVVPAEDLPRRAWLLRARPPFELPTRPYFLVDADSGRFLARGDLARAADRVHAFAANPTASPTLDTFTLDRLTGGATAKTLTTAQLVALGCVDRHAVRSVPGLLTSGSVSVHSCDLAATAMPDASFDFLYPRPTSDAEESDALAETSVAYHTDRALTFFSDLGLTSLRKEAVPLTVIANVRMPSGWSGASVGDLACTTCALERLDNAYYVPSPDPFEDVFPHHGDALFLGQGKSLDFAYDGDVVVHEAGHALVASTAKLVGFFHADDQGASDAPSAMNEGLADYFSAALAGDPRVGEYAGGGSPIRRLDNTDRCPDVFFGEPHSDSTAFSGALWTARGKSADARAFDRGVVVGLQMAPSGDLDFADLAALLEEGVKKEAGAAAATALTEAMTARSLLPCTRVRQIASGGGKSFGFGFLSVGAALPAGNGPDGVTPGVVQFHQALPTSAVRVTIRMTLREFPAEPAWLGPEAWTPELLVKLGDAKAMKFTAGKGDFTARAPAAAAATFVVPTGATDLHLMIAAATGQGLYDDVSVDVTRVDPPIDAGPDATGDASSDASVDAFGDARADSADPHADALVDAGADVVVPSGPDAPSDGGCGCRTERTEGRGLPTLLTLFGVTLASLIVNRRRRRT